MMETNHKSFTLTDEQRRLRDARLRLAQEVAALLSTQNTLITPITQNTPNTQSTPTTSLTPTMSNLDLMEALHIAYDTGVVTCPDGEPMTFMQIVRRVCRLFNRPVPMNPYDCARRGEQRKGVLRHNFLTRYARELKNNSDSI